MSVIYVMFLRELRRYVRSRAQIVASLGQPLLYLVALGFGLGPVFQKAGQGSYLQFMAPGVIAMTVLFSSIFSGMGLLWDRQFGFLKETLVAPVPRIQVMLGRTQVAEFSPLQYLVNNLNSSAYNGEAMPFRILKPCSEATPSMPSTSLETASNCVSTAAVPHAKVSRRRPLAASAHH